MNPVWSTLIGTVVGGTMTGTITIALWLLSQKEVRRQRREDRGEERLQRQQDRDEQRRALGNALLFKMSKVCQDVHAIDGHFVNCFERAARDKFKGKPWQVVLPLANPPEPIIFSTEEMAMLLSLQNDQVFNAIMEVERRHNTLISAVRVFNSERIALGERLSAASTDQVVSGQMVTGTIREDMRAVIRAKMIDVNSLIEGTHGDARSANEMARQTSGQLQDLLRSRLGLTHRIAFVEPIPAQAAITD